MPDEDELTEGDALLNRLAVMVMPSEMLDTQTPEAIRRPGLPGLEMVLVDSTSTPPRPISASDLTAFGGPDEPGLLDELWAEALERTGESHVPDIDVEELVDGVPIMILAEQSPFGATNALWPERFLEVPPDGLLMAVPHRHMVWIHAVRDEGVVTALARILLATRARFLDAGEHQVSEQLYWWHDGSYEVIEATTIEPDEPEEGEETTELVLGLPEGFEEIFRRYVPEG